MESLAQVQSCGVCVSVDSLLHKGWPWNRIYHMVSHGSQVLGPVLLKNPSSLITLEMALSVSYDFQVALEPRGVGYKVRAVDQLVLRPYPCAYFFDVSAWMHAASRRCWYPADSRP